MIDHQLLDEVPDRTTAAILADLLARVAALEASQQPSLPQSAALTIKGRAAADTGTGGAGARPQTG